eukprot:765319-Hanusia_phi.AAC.2
MVPLSPPLLPPFLLSLPSSAPPLLSSSSFPSLPPLLRPSPTASPQPCTETGRREEEKNPEASRASAAQREEEYCSDQQRTRTSSVCLGRPHQHLPHQTGKPGRGT